MGIANRASAGENIAEPDGGKARAGPGAQRSTGADVDHDQIRLVLKNLERLGEYSYVYDYDEFNNDLFEELGKAILAQPNRLRRMGRHQGGNGQWTGPLRRATDPEAATAAGVV